LSGPDAAEADKFSNAFRDNFLGAVLDLVKEPLGLVTGIGNSFAEFNSTLAAAIKDPSAQNIEAVTIKGVEFGLGVTAAAIGYALGISLAAAGFAVGATIAAGIAVGTALDVAANYGAAALVAKGNPPEGPAAPVAPQGTPAPAVPLAPQVAPVLP
jgi:hypothetical protein